MGLPATPQISAVLRTVAVSVAALSAALASAQDRSEYYARFLEKLDSNGDGVLEPDEVSDRARRYVDRLAERAGLDASRPLAISRLLNPTKPKSGKDRRSKRRSTFNTEGSGDGVPGFGEADEAVTVPGFDVPLGTQPLEARYSAAVIREADSILRRYDRDESGVLEPTEIRQGNWRDDPKNSDLNQDGKLSKDELCERVAAHWSQRDGNDSHRKGGGSATAASTTSSPNQSGNPAGNDSEKLRRYADSLLRQYDENKNGVLEKDEWSRMRGNPAESDKNQDGVITRDELVVRLGNYSRGSSSGGSGSSRGSSKSGSYRKPYASSRSRSSEGKAKLYRATMPTEKLPKGLPSWFARNDANEDGQIAMSEYSANWSDSKAAEFAGIDTNRDGVITPAECLAAEAAKRP